MIRALFTNKGSTKAAMLLVGFIVLIAAAFFVLSSSNSVASTWANRQAGEKIVLKGEVVGIDHMRHLMVLTVQSNEIGQFPNDQMHVYVNPKAMTKICNATEPAKDMTVDRSAIIRYHEVGGLAVADSVSERC